MNKHSTLTDEQLIASLTEGNRSAFETIYRRYAPGLLTYARKTIADREECREIVQDIFESVWARRHSLQVESLKAYLFMSARYRMIKYFRRARLMRTYAEHYIIFESAYESLPDEERDQEAVRDKVINALEGLADRCRTAFKLRLTENLSNSEIAERMNITKGTVELYMVKAVSHLKANLSSGIHDNGNP